MGGFNLAMLAACAGFAWQEKNSAAKTRGHQDGRPGINS